MRGLIYKDIQLFFRSLDRKLLIIASAAIVLLLVNGGLYGGLLGSIMFSIAIGMQNNMSFFHDTVHDWNRYQRALPLRGCTIVASKYLSILLTLAVSVMGSVIFVGISGLLHGGFDGFTLGLAVWCAVLLPLIWTGLCLPLTYWFGFRAAQTAGFFVIFPLVYVIQYFENKTGLQALPISGLGWMLLVTLATFALYGISFLLSLLAYSRKKAS